jgi:hypothetical protein
MKASRIISQSPLSLSVKPAVEEKSSPEKTATSCVAAVWHVAGSVPLTHVRIVTVANFKFPKI